MHISYTYDHCSSVVAQSSAHAAEIKGTSVGRCVCSQVNIGDVVSSNTRSPIQNRSDTHCATNAFMAHQARVGPSGKNHCLTLQRL